MEVKTNGAGLDDRQTAALNFTFAEHLRVKGELEAVQRDNAQLREAIAQALTQIETLRSWTTELESQVESAGAKRDQAVAERAVYETLFVSINAQMRAFKVPAAPLIREVESGG